MPNISLALDLSCCYEGAVDSQCLQTVVSLLAASVHGRTGFCSTHGQLLLARTSPARPSKHVIVSN
jgi:hypothetical protein